MRVAGGLGGLSERGNESSEGPPGSSPPRPPLARTTLGAGENPEPYCRSYPRSGMPERARREAREGRRDRTLPLAVILNRLAADLFVLTFAPGLPATTVVATDLAATGAALAGTRTAETARRKPRPDTLEGAARRAEDTVKDAIVGMGSDRWSAASRLDGAGACGGGEARRPSA